MHPEKKTIIDSVTYRTIFGLILREKCGTNLMSVISTGEVYAFKEIIIFIVEINKFILTKEWKSFLLSNPDIKKFKIYFIFYFKKYLIFLE